ncbi:helix-turn-helix domain-containing protein [Acidovorax sp. 99]|uniref:helix-turn-helix domain-containing protein n=1 Tax=Acidovorax sp. 99 TaxID=2135634 RepID=UPI00325FBB9B
MTNTPPSLRLFELLETMCAQGQPFSLGDAIEATGWPKPSVHRMLGQLEAGGLLAREPDGRRYTPRTTSAAPGRKHAERGHPAWSAPRCAAATGGGHWRKLQPHGVERR